MRERIDVPFGDASVSGKPPRYTCFLGNCDTSTTCPTEHSLFAMHDLQHALARFSRFLRDAGLLDRLSYHPERHYMRGPGPACQRKTIAQF